MMKQNLAKYHAQVYGRLNAASTRILQNNARRIPLWLTADIVTTGRLTLVLPTAALLSHGHTWLPAGLVLTNAVLDYVDGAIARWEREDPDRSAALAKSLNDSSDKDIVYSKKTEALNKYWGAYYDALADKLFAIPIWFSICILNPDLPWIQVAALSHVTVESVSAYTRTRSYFLKPEASSAIVTAKATGKVKQAISMCGTAMALVPQLHIVGGVLLWLSLPLSFSSLKDKFEAKSIPRALIYTPKPISSSTLVALLEVEKKYEVILCVKSEQIDEKIAALNLGDIIHGVTTLQKDMDEDKFNELGGTVLYVGSQEELSQVDPSLVERGLVRVL